MSNTEATHDARSPAPAEDAPEYGQVRVGEAVLTAARRWVDDEGTYVIESLEFDIVGLGANWTEAVSNLVDRADDLFDHLADLVPGGQITDTEGQAAALIGRRVVDFYQAWTRELETYLEEAARRKPNLLDALFSSRRRVVRQHPDTWLTQTPKSLSRLLKV